MKQLLRLIIVTAFFSQSTYGCSQETQTNRPINKNSKPFETDVYLSVDSIAEFPGGYEGLFEFYQKHTSYTIAKNEKEGSTVYFSVVIDENGEVYNSRILKSEDKELEQITTNIIREMPRWKAAKLDGKKVKAIRNLSITYLKK